MKTYSRKNSSYIKKAFIASNFNEMCRLCLSEVNLGLTPIFQEYSKISYQEWIKYSVDVLIEEGDGLPTNICEECLAMVKQIYLFKKKCKASDSKLREHLALIEINEEGKLNEIGLIDLTEDHKNLFKKESPSEMNFDENSIVDSGGTDNQHPSQEQQTDKVKSVEENEIQNLFSDAEFNSTQHEEKAVINQVKRYVLRGEKGGDGQEEDLTVCEVIPLDVREEKPFADEMDKNTLTYTTLECPSQNGHTGEGSSPQGMRIQEIYQLWGNEEEGETEPSSEKKEEEGETEPSSEKKEEEGIMILDVSWEDNSDKSEKKQNMGLLEVDVEQNGVVQLHRVSPSKGQSELKVKEKKEDTKTSKCFVCGSDFRTCVQLKDHLTKVHKELAEAAFCEICGKSFSFNNNLKRHMAVHTGYKPHKCKICGRTFNQGSILKRHILTHEILKPFNCHICGKGYTQKMNLVTHFRLHGFQTGSDIYKCKQCKKSFMHQSGLSRHLKAHKGVRFICEHCKKSFGDSSALARHIKAFHESKALVEVNPK